MQDHGSWAGCLISPLFPFKLLSLQAFTKRGHVVTLEQEHARISNTVNDVVLLGVRDPISKLFLLQEVPSTATLKEVPENQLQQPENQLLAKSYGGSESELLWKLLVTWASEFS